jgi:uncharacterized protein YbjT (DUF2867 family)
MRVLILGGNGFIGSAVAATLAGRGHAVTALARDTAKASRRMPQIGWTRADIARLAAPKDWQPLLAGIDAIVNCAGALQDSARDDVAAVQDVAMRALYQAAMAGGIGLIVQVSARTDGSAADNPFFATKRSADQALAASGVPFVILRPALVVGRNAYGGTALLRALASVPFVTPLAHGSTPMQFVALDELAEAIADAIDGTIAAGSDIALAAPETMALSQAVAMHRAWLGLRPVRSFEAPQVILKLTAWGADLLGHLGWRSPLRSTAAEVATGGVSGHAPSPRRLKTLAETLQAAPAGVQDLWFARLYLLKPVLFGVLSLFWVLSGAIALVRFDAAAAWLILAGFSPAVANAATLITALLDIALGIAVVFRRYAAPALLGMIGISVIYLFIGTILLPALWADPLGPLVKILPSILLPVVALAILDER